MSREQVNGRFGNYDARPVEWHYGLGTSEAVHAVEMGRVCDAFRRGTFGRHATIEAWVEEMIYPSSQDDAIRLVKRLRARKGVTA